jgi:hypothetical protein
MSIEERINRLEQISTHKNIPGTTLQRIMTDKQLGIVWSLGIGSLAGPKQFFIDKSVEGCIAQAEKELL